MSQRHAAPLLRPNSLESKVEFLARWNSNENVGKHYPTVVKRRLMGQKAWLRAKQDSLVSLHTSEGEFLLFGSLNPDKDA